MTDNEMMGLAQEFAQEHMGDFEFLSLAEADGMEDTGVEDLRRIHELIVTAKVTLSWPGKHLTLGELKALPVGTRVECEDGYDIFHSVFGWVVLSEQGEWATSPTGADHMLLRRPVKVREEQW